MNISTPIKTFTSREFNQDTAKAKRVANKGPVFITTRGETTHVLMAKEEYDRLWAMKEKPMTLREALMDPNGDDFDFDPPRLDGPLFKRFELE